MAPMQRVMIVNAILRMSAGAFNRGARAVGGVSIHAGWTINMIATEALVCRILPAANDCAASVRTFECATRVRVFQAHHSRAACTLAAVAQ